MDKTDSATITRAIQYVLLRCILFLESCRGQAYDGAANMMGRLKGVAKQILDVEQHALIVHCFAHCLSLSLMDASKNSEYIRKALDICGELARLTKLSPKRSAVFDSCKAEMVTESPGIKPLCPTRWTVRTGAVDAILKNYDAMVNALDIISDQCHDDYGKQASGLLAQLEKFNVYFGLCLAHLIFGATEQVSISLQGRNTTIQ